MARLPVRSSPPVAPARPGLGAAFNWCDDGSPTGVSVTANGTCPDGSLPTEMAPASATASSLSTMSTTTTALLVGGAALVALLLWKAL